MRRRVAAIGVFVMMALGLAGCGGGGDGSSTPTGGGTTYSAATLSGPWLLITDPGKTTYLIPDGNGSIIENGMNNASTPPGTYQVQANGALTITLNTLYSGAFSMNGTMTSSTAGTLTSPGAGSIQKISNQAASQGTWSGTLTETGTSTVRNISITVNAVGTVNSITGFTAQASGIIGKMYSESGKAVASLKTTDAGLYGQIRIDGTVTGNSLSGTCQTSSNSSSSGASGTVVLTKQ